MTADTKPSLISYSEQFQADVASVDTNFTEARNKLLDLMPRKFEKFSGFTVRRGREVDILPSPALFRSAEIEMIATTSEVTSAPDDMQRLFLDLGIESGDEIAIEVMMGKRTKLADTRKYANTVYSVTLMPTVYRPDLVGVEFNYAKQWWFLKPGTPVHKPESADTWYGSKRIREMVGVYEILREGMVYDSYEEGTHASITRYRQKPHPYLAAIHKGAADWITTLVDSRMR